MENSRFNFRAIPLFGESFVFGSLIIEPNERGEDTYTIRRYENGRVCYFEVKKETIGQYTGLKDKNGVEIYEGDLLQSFYDDGEIHEVIWHEESASFRVATYLDNRHGGSFAELFFMDDIHENCNKIIGNIYENTELLEYKNEKDWNRSNLARWYK